MATVGDSVMVVASPLWGPLTDAESVSVWTTTDGRTWVDVTPDRTDETSSLSTSWFEMTETDDAVILGFVGSRFITRDGLTFEKLSTGPATGQRYRSDVGWVAMEAGVFALWVSPDGDDWESHRIEGLHGLRYAGSSPYGEVSVIGSTIYVIIDSGRDDGRGVLLIGEVASTP